VVGYGFAAVQDVGDWVTFSDHSAAQLGVYVGRGTAFDFIHAGGCVVFALAFGPALTRSIARFAERLQVTWRSFDGAVLPALLTGLRERMSMSTAQVAGELVQMLGLPTSGEAKTASYLDRLEQGKLEPARVSRRVFDALSRLFRVPRDELEGAGGWTPRPAMSPAPVFRADTDAAHAVSDHLELLADALQAPGGEGRDEIDDLFLGGR
jgi:transcriptional regulator with XRE-family HTH domain